VRTSATVLALASCLVSCGQRIVVATDGRGRAEAGVEEGGVRLDAGLIASDGGVLDGAPKDAAPPRDALPLDAFSFDARPADTGPPEVGPRDAIAFDATPPQDALPPDFGIGGGLDPSLELPDPSGVPCLFPGDLNECPGIAVCRFFTPQEGRCESCSPCGNLNAPCSSSAECDILFSCYLGRCTNFCTLGTFECGPIDECIDIGHPTLGVCLPG
jgi:hypothetical protein